MFIYKYSKKGKNTKYHSLLCMKLLFFLHSQASLHLRLTAFRFIQELITNLIIIVLQTVKRI